MREKPTSRIESESLGDTFPYQKVENLAITDAKEQINRWRAVEGSVVIATILSEVAVSAHFGTNRVIDVLTHLVSGQTVQQFAHGISEIFSNINHAWNSPETCVAWIGAIMLIGVTAVGGTELVIKNRNDTLGGHVDELDTIRNLLDKPDPSRSNAIDTLDQQIKYLEKESDFPAWTNIIKSCKDAILKPKKTLLKWRKELNSSDKWDKKWNKNTDKLLLETQDAYSSLELASVLKSETFAKIDPSKANRNLANSILDRIGRNKSKAIMDGITDDYDTSTIELTSLAIREWTGNTKHTHQLESDLTNEKPYNAEFIQRRSKSLEKSISSAESEIGSLEISKITVRTEYAMKITGVSNSDPEQKQKEISNIRADEASAISEIDVNIASQQEFITNTQNVLSTIDDLVTTATHEHKIENPEDLLAPYSLEESINEYFDSNS